jgi:hypothetical protein
MQGLISEIAKYDICLSLVKLNEIGQFLLALTMPLINLYTITLYTSFTSIIH